MTTTTCPPYCSHLSPCGYGDCAGMAANRRQADEQRTAAAAAATQTGPATAKQRSYIAALARHPHAISIHIPRQMTVAGASSVIDRLLAVGCRAERPARRPRTNTETGGCCPTDGSTCLVCGGSIA